MPISRIFQDEINASEATQAASGPTASQITRLQNPKTRSQIVAAAALGLADQPAPNRATAPTPITPSGATTVRSSYSPTSPSSPAGAPSPTAPGSGADADAGAPGNAVDLDALEQMLAAIEAQYGLNREQLLAGEGEASDLYRFVVANLASARQQAVQGVKEGGIRRGILRSGITAENQARVQNQFAQQEQDAIAQRDRRLADISLALQQLDADLNREKTNTAVQYAETNLGTDEDLARALQLV